MRVFEVTVSTHRQLHRHKHCRLPGESVSPPVSLDTSQNSRPKNDKPQMGDYVIELCIGLVFGRSDPNEGNACVCVSEFLIAFAGECSVSLWSYFSGHGP